MRFGPRPAAPAHDPRTTQAVRVTAHRAGRLARAVLVGVGTGVAVFVLAVLVRGQWAPLARLDEHAVRWGTSVAGGNPRLLDALVWWQWVFAPSRLAVLVAAACLLYWWRTRRISGYRSGTRTWWALVTILVTWGLSNLLKVLVQRARPVLDQPVEHAGGYSFPSGHATNTAAMLTALVVLVWPSLRTRAARVAAASGAAVLTLATALDRVMLGVHYPSDVVAGMLFGVGTVLASYLGYRHWSSPAEKREEAL